MILSLALLGHLEMQLKFFYMMSILVAAIQLHEPGIERSQLIKKVYFDFPEKSPTSHSDLISGQTNYKEMLPVL